MQWPPVDLRALLSLGPELSPCRMGCVLLRAAACPPGAASCPPGVCVTAVHSSALNTKSRSQVPCCRRAVSVGQGTEVWWLLLFAAAVEVFWVLHTRVIKSSSLISWGHNVLQVLINLVWL